MNELIEGNTKICSICGIEKLISKFELHRSGKSRRPYCYTCKNQKSQFYKHKVEKQGKEYRTLEQKKQQYLNQVAIGIKKCSKCGEIKPFNKFPKDYRKKHIKGWSAELRKNMCIDCKNEYRRFREKAKRGTDWKPHMRIKLSDEKRKEFKRQSQIKAQKKARERYWNDLEYREKVLQYSREHHQKDRSKMLARKHKREAIMIKQHDGTVTPKEFRRILEERKTCPYCGDPIGKAEMDHMDPVSKGGLHSITNIIGICHRCNSDKRNKPFVEWLSFIKEERRDYVIRIYEKKHGARPEQGALALRYNINHSYHINSSHNKKFGQELLRIQDAAEILKVSVNGIRHLERKGLIDIPKNEYGHRIFNRELIEKIKELYI